MQKLTKIDKILENKNMHNRVSKNISDTTSTKHFTEFCNLFQMNSLVSQQHIFFIELILENRGAFRCDKKQIETAKSFMKHLYSSKRKL